MSRDVATTGRRWPRGYTRRQVQPERSRSSRIEQSVTIYLGGLRYDNKRVEYLCRQSWRDSRWASTNQSATQIWCRNMINCAARGCQRQFSNGDETRNTRIVCSGCSCLSCWTIIGVLPRYAGMATVCQHTQLTYSDASSQYDRVRDHAAILSRAWTTPSLLHSRRSVGTAPVI